MDERLQNWYRKRCGRITSSALKDLMTKGRGKGDKYGVGAVDYLYQKKRERRTGKPVFERDNYNFIFGHDNEKYAIAWLRHNTELDIRSCADDFPEIVFDIHPEMDFVGDSPDFFVGDDVGEIKCPINEAKLERLLGASREDVVEEYRDQLCGHLSCHPKAEKLYYLVYDGTHDADEFDERDPNDRTRGKLFVFRRSEFEERIAEIEAREREAWDFLLMAEEQGLPLEAINDYLKTKEEKDNGTT